MEEFIENHELQPTGVDESNLLISIWAKPKVTLQYILENCPDKYMAVLLVLGGIVRAIDRAYMNNMGNSMSLAATLTFAVIGGALFGWMSYYIYGWALRVTGNWINGEASATEFRTVIAWSLVPSICSLILLVPQVVLFGDDLFKSDFEASAPLDGLLLFVAGLLEIILAIWTLVILVNGVMLVQGFGVGKAILNIVLPVLLLIIPVVLIAMML